MWKTLADSTESARVLYYDAEKLHYVLLELHLLQVGGVG